MPSPYEQLYSCSPLGSAIQHIQQASSSASSSSKKATPSDIVQRSGRRRSLRGASLGLTTAPYTPLAYTPLNGGSSSNIYDLQAPSGSTSWAIDHHWWEYSKWSDEEINAVLWNHRTIFAAGTASLVSTAASFPFDSLKSRLQVKHYPSIWSCGKAVWKEEGLAGFFRGVTVPMITISLVRTSSFAIYVNTKDWLHRNSYLADRSKISNTALSGMAGGATSGVIIR